MASRQNSAVSDSGSEKNETSANIKIYDFGSTPSSSVDSGGHTATPTRSVPLVTVTDETGTRTITSSGHCLSMDSADIRSVDKRKWFQSKWFSATTTKDRREKFKRRTFSLETDGKDKAKGKRSLFSSSSRQASTDSQGGLNRTGSSSTIAGPSDGKSMRSRRPISRLSSVWSEVVHNSVVGGGEESDYSDNGEEDVKETSQETRAAARWRIIKDRIGEVIFFGDRDLDYEYEPHPNAMGDRQRLAHDAFITSHLYTASGRRLSGPFPITTKGRRHQAIMSRSLDRSHDPASYDEGNVQLSLEAHNTVLTPI